MKKILIINFPEDLEQSMKFDVDVKTVDNIIKVENSSDDKKKDVFEYFETVDKIKNIKSTKNLSEFYKN